MNEVHLNFQFKARYCQLGTINEQTEHVWFVCHGYGQLAESFIKNFEVLDDNKHCIIAPEGLSRFYLNGFVGRVGATWMTKEDRLTDIENYINYLNAIYEDAIGSRKDLHITLLGFSQGVATISRWANQEDLHFHRLVLWAGVIPPDLNVDLARRKLNQLEIFIVYGDMDPYIKQQQLNEQNKHIEDLRIDPTILVFEGLHVIDRKTLLKISTGSD
ncbi:alpha/beta hydrolase [Fulvivirgaceae bacterium BMA12]|uniref:Alpha/beta hydrolase n=1 Tax=Agaribacillus aureus TaxID=3051825 RepID=A0ABT8L8B3_9BACT|nr:alpha/beta hydrolase [Fulvivirgaceae bacterium BMA12]